MSIFMAELLGTALMILLGNGVVATCLLKGTKFDGSSSWLVITTAWGLAVFCGVVIAGDISGAHLNPAVTLAVYLNSNLSLNLIPQYLAGQLLGSMIGAFLVYLFYKKHFDITEDEGLKKACFCTEPAIKSLTSNFFSEFIGAFVLIFVILHLVSPSIVLNSDTNATIGLGSIEALPVALLVWVIGLSLGSTTGYAINPVRDFGPRLILFLLPLKIKADFKYGLIPIIAPIFGSFCASYLYLFLR